MFDDSGESYVGHWDWKRDRPQGEGEWVYSSGDICRGRFDNGKAAGWCEYKFSNGDVYQGAMKYGKAQGYGVKYFNDGSYYKGYFCRDLCEGYGTFYYYSEGKITKKEEGTWRKGHMINGEVSIYGDMGLEQKISFVRLI